MGSIESKNFTSSLLDKLEKCGNNIFCLVVTNQLSLIPSSLRREGLLETEIEIPVQSNQDKNEILKFYLDKLELETENKPDVAAIADRLHGFVASDIVSLVKLAYAQYRQGIYRHCLAFQAYVFL